MNSVKLSVVIATRGREYYCIKSIKTMLSFIDDSTEIVVSDNSTTTQIKEFVEGLKDDRIKYAYSNELLTMSENYNAGISLATGEYICMIGDDDIVLPSIYGVLKYAIHNNVDCITQKKVINYIWPDDNNKGTLYLPFFTRKYRIINSKDNYINYIKDGCCTNPRDYKLPALYHGLVKREVLSRIYKDTGIVIAGISPDAYMAVILSAYVKHQQEVDLPFSIGGACSSSATVSNIRGKHCGELTESAQYVGNINKGYVWREEVPTYYSVQTIWADSALHAVFDKNICNLFSLEKMTARAIIENRHIAKDIQNRTIAFIKEKEADFSWGKMYIYLSVYFIGKVKRRVLSRFSKDNRISIKSSIGEIDGLLRPEYRLID